MADDDRLRCFRTGMRIQETVSELMASIRLAGELPADTEQRHDVDETVDLKFDVLSSEVEDNAGTCGMPEDVPTGIKRAHELYVQGSLDEAEGMLAHLGDAMEPRPAAGPEHDTVDTPSTEPSG